MVTRRLLMDEDDPAEAPDGAVDYVAHPQKRERRRPEPLKVSVELVVVDGELGRELLQRQAAAVREALRWFAENPPAEPRSGDHPGRPPRPNFEDLE
jgi:hypothetical protein